MFSEIKGVYSLLCVGVNSMNVTAFIHEHFKITSTKSVTPFRLS